MARIHRIDRRTVLCGTAHGESEDALLHPYLGSTALAVAAWAGDFSLHAGVIRTASGCWGLLGDRGAGKTSALGWALTHGVPVVADDLLITDGLVVRAGPRFIDFRLSAAEHFGIGVDVGHLGTRRRWRAACGPVEAEAPLAGLVELAWGPRIGVEPVEASGRLAMLARHRGLRIPVDDRRSVLQVLAMPAVRFTRPKSWAAMDDAMTALISELDRAG